MKNDLSDPWKAIKRPDKMSTVTARRVDSSSPWGVFWAVDVDGNCLLMLQHGRDAMAPRRLPKLRGLQVETRLPEEGPHGLLVIRLLEREQREIFHRLCLDIVAATVAAKAEEEAIERFLGRTWRWHRLLRSGRDGRLSEEEQRGLAGELRFLGRHLFPTLGIAVAVRCWTGPLDAPKDFEIGRTSVEVKARRGTATPQVPIASEHQLDSSGVGSLLLYVAEVTAATEGTVALTITEIAEEVRSVIAAREPAAIELFEERLLSMGFDWEDDYSDKRWFTGREHLFEVREGFPRITASMVPGGVQNVHYSISLPECESFRVDISELKNLLSGGSCGDRH